MRTLPRNGSAKHGNRAQVSGPSGARCEFLCRILLCAVAMLLGSQAYAADPQSYKVDLASTGNSEMNATLKATSDLITLRTSAPVGPFGLIGRARSDLDRLKTVLESYGYYQSYVAITIDGLALDDPTLGDELTSKAKGNDARVKATFNIGPLYHLRRVDIDGEIPQSVQGALALSTGAPAVASQVLAAGDRLQTALEDQGYAFAKVDTPVAHEDPPNRVLDVSFHVVTGARVNIGEIRFRGLKRMHEAFVRNRLLIHKGEQYGAGKIERARKDLLALGVFTSVTVQLGTQADSAGEVPVTFRMRERPLHLVNLSAAYSTDLGASSGVTWTDRNMTGRADSLALSASVINLGGSASNGIGYDLGAKYLLPEFGHRDQSLQLAVQAIHQSLQAYDQKALTFGATLSRKFSPEWTASVGLTAEVERIGQEGFYYSDCTSAPNSPTCTPPKLDDKTDELVNNTLTCTATGCTAEYFTPSLLTTNYTLLGVPFTLLYNSTGQDSPLEDATHGFRASFSETPTLSFGRTAAQPAGFRAVAAPAAKNAKFFITQGSASYYFDLHNLGLNPDPGRSVLALRALAGLAQGAGQYSLPPDQRFYAGGSGTVRGFRYQSVGPLFNDGNPIGGTAINAGQAEFRQRIGANLGFAVFMDAGQVSQKVNPLDSTLRFGAGAGVRYYTPIGPLRVDFGIPINREHAFNAAEGKVTATGDAFELYIGLGQSF
jgi:translocation and assembly module TamA